MNVGLKYLLYMLIISSTVDYAFFKPIRSDEIYAANYHRARNVDDKFNYVNTLRLQRQVVQPKWLTGKDDFSIFVDKKVHVNERNLKETAELRAAVQDAVNDGKYFVDAPTDGISAVPIRPPLVTNKKKANFKAPPAPTTKWWTLIIPGNEQSGELVEQMQRSWIEFLKLFTFF